jgi:hypothetical protein
MGALDLSALGHLGPQWALWLIAPLVVPVLVAIGLWWRGRPRRPPTVPESIAGHQAYLQALDAARGVAKAGVKRDG